MPQPSFVRYALRLSALVGVTVGFVACDLSTEVPNLDGDYGIMTFSAVKTGATTYRAKASGEFFRGTLTALPNATAPYDSCRDGAIIPDTGTANVTELDPGTPLTVTLGGTSTTLNRVASGSRFVFKPSGDGTIAYNPGDSVTVSVPGATSGFPAVQLRSRTAEAFTMDPVPTTASSDITMRWSAAPVDRSALIVQLRYATTGTELNRELRCFLVDDGTHTIPSAMATLWTAVANTRRDVIATRMRTDFLRPDNGDALFEIVSLFQLPTPTTP